jgi:hypothetical protein
VRIELPLTPSTLMLVHPQPPPRAT